ncbi:hypothetical protein ACFL31_02770 [Candidatus Margulisiibacteriota bacterium]
MGLIRPAGEHSAATRSYRLSLLERVKYLASTGQFPNLAEVQRVVRQNSQAEWHEKKAVLVMLQQHLPRKLVQQLQRLPAFSQFCQAIAFSSSIILFKCQDAAGMSRLPNSTAEHSMARMENTPGFPVTRPVEEVDPQVAYSFTKPELEALLGPEFMEHAGRMMFLNLHDPGGRPYSNAGLASTAGHFLEILENSK